MICLNFFFQSSCIICYLFILWDRIIIDFELSCYLMISIVSYSAVTDMHLYFWIQLNVILRTSIMFYCCYIIVLNKEVSICFFCETSYSKNINICEAYLKITSVTCRIKLWQTSEHFKIFYITLYHFYYAYSGVYVNKMDHTQTMSTIPDLTHSASLSLSFKHWIGYLWIIQKKNYMILSFNEWKAIYCLNSLW